MDTVLTGRGAGADVAVPAEAPSSAVSWPAIIAGAFVAVSVSLILLALGSGLGLGMASPWPGDGASATTFTVVTAIWLIVVQWVASGFGGYLTGRLRTRWTRLHAHEVFFRDTAHGFITWALATVVTVSLVALAASAALGAGVRAASTVASGAAQGAASAAADSVNAYDVDALFRSARPDAGSSAEAREEATRIFARSLATGTLPAEDRTYLAQLISAHTGISQEEAVTRLDAVSARINAANVKVREAADAARKAGALASLYTALSMLIGAFIASVAAVIGGHQRDEHV
jgi:hypothetical protein